MNNTGYICYIIVLKILGVNVQGVQLEQRFGGCQDTDFEIMKVSKELGLKAKFSSVKNAELTVLVCP